MSDPFQSLFNTLARWARARALAVFLLVIQRPKATFAVSCLTLGLLVIATYVTANRSNEKLSGPETKAVIAKPALPRISTQRDKASFVPQAARAPVSPSSPENTPPPSPDETEDGLPGMRVPVEKGALSPSVVNPGTAAESAASPDRSIPQAEIGPEARGAAPKLDTSKLDRSINSVLYEPIIEFGNSQAKHTIFFVWSAVSEASLTEFRKRIAPIAAKGSKADVWINLYQIFDFGPYHDLVGPGAYLLCPDDYWSYTKLAVAYLSRARNVTKSLRLENDDGLYSNAYIRRSIQNHRLDRSLCRKANFMTRQLLQLRASRALIATAKGMGAPFYVVDGKALAVDDPLVAEILNVPSTARR